MTAVDLSAPQILLQWCQSKGGQWGGQQLLERLAQPFHEILVAMSLFAAGEYPKLMLPWLSSSSASIVRISQPVLWPSHCPILFLVSILLYFFFFFIVMGFAEQLLTLELLSDNFVFFSCRLHLCIVLLNCGMNVRGHCVTESFPTYCISFRRTAVETVMLWIRVNIYTLNRTEALSPLWSLEFVSISTCSELSIKDL